VWYESFLQALWHICTQIGRSAETLINTGRCVHPCCWHHALESYFNLTPQSHTSKLCQSTEYSWLVSLNRFIFLSRAKACDGTDKSNRTWFDAKACMAGAYDTSCNITQRSLAHIESEKERLKVPRIPPSPIASSPRQIVKTVGFPSATTCS